ncbi:MAG: manganese efflux pump [Fretibacterium sp.]|nr:manganese efflux pump [Fretibacterium sp.]
MWDWGSLLSGLSLAMDAFAASICVGGCITGSVRAPALRMAGACGFFQFVMPLLGWLLGSYCADLVASFDHWLAFIILACVGGNMVRSSFKAEDSCPEDDPTRSFKLLFSLALATSIDAFAVGASFAFLKLSAWPLSVIAGVFTSLLCAGGVWLGCAVGGRLGKRAELVGGLFLFGLGSFILVTHLNGVS